MASATSSTHTGWNRASAPASGITGNTACSAANRLRKLVVGAEDDRRPQDRQVERPRPSAPPRRRPCCAGSSTAHRRPTPSALTCTTPLHAGGRAGRAPCVAASCTCTCSKSRALPCRMATRLTTASLPGEHARQLRVVVHVGTRPGRPSAANCTTLACASAARRHDDAACRRRRRARPGARRPRGRRSRCRPAGRCVCQRAAARSLDDRFAPRASRA